jgi:serine/threonine protein kinase
LNALPKRCVTGEKMSNFVGTAEYVSPEVLTGKPVHYGVDLWALGCIIYQMLEGRPPFKAATEYLTFEKVMACEFTMPSHFSSEAQDLVNHLLDLKPEKRLGSQGLDKLKNHSFFKGADWLKLRKLLAPTLTVAPKGVSTQDSDEGSADSEWDIELGSKFSDLSVADLSSGSSSPVGSPSDLNTNHPSLSPAPKVISPPSPNSSESSDGPLPEHSNVGPPPQVSSKALPSSESSTAEHNKALQMDTLAESCHLGDWYVHISKKPTI